jgi:hypothetical protein
VSAGPELWLAGYSEHYTTTYTEIRLVRDDGTIVTAKERDKLLSEWRAAVLDRSPEAARIGRNGQKRGGR